MMNISGSDVTRMLNLPDFRTLVPAELTQRLVNIGLKQTQLIEVDAARQEVTQARAQVTTLTSTYDNLMRAYGGIRRAQISDPDPKNRPGYDQQRAELSARITEVTSQIDGLQTRIRALDTRIGALQTRIGELDQLINGGMR